MQVLKQAWWLAKFELRHSVMGTLLLFCFSLIFSIFYAYSYSENDLKVVLDLFFVYNIWIVTTSIRPKNFQYQKIEEGTYASPHFIFLRQLPITNRVLILNRFFTYFSISIPYNVIHMLFFYLFSKNLRADLPIDAFFVWIIIWSLFGICIGALFPISDVGDKLKMKMWIYGTFALLIIYGGTIAIIVATSIFTGKSVITWSIYVAVHYPLLSISSMTVLTIILFFFYVKSMKKKIITTDYIQ